MNEPVINTASMGDAHFSLARVVEAVVIAAFTGMLTVWGMQAAMKSDLDWMKTSIAELKGSVSEMRHDIYEVKKR